MTQTNLLTYLGYFPRPRRHTLFLALSVLCTGALAASPLVGAQTAEQQTQQQEVDEIEVDEIIIIANRIPVSANRVGVSVTVLEQQQIDAHGNLSLDTILRQTTAVGVSRNGGQGSISSLRIRGEEGFRTLFLYDGLRLSDPSSPQVSTPVEHILSDGISRVEILRGPQGLNYGADAGGIVSISTHNAKRGFSGSINGQLGSRGTAQLGASVSGGNDKVDFALSATEHSSDGFNTQVADTILADDDGYENSSLHARFGFNATENLRIDLVHHTVGSELQYDGCFSGTTVFDCQSFYDLKATAITAKYSLGGSSHSLAYSTIDTERNDLALGMAAFGSSGDLNRIEYLGNATTLPGFDLIWGIDLEEEENGAAQRDNRGYYLEFLSDFSDHLFITAGLRQDDNDDFGEHTSYRITAAYLVNLDADNLMKFKASYGTGFRAPSLFEIGYNSGAFAFPPASNTILNEETSRGFEYGVEYNYRDRLSLELTLFDQEIEDAIFFDLSSFSGFLQDLGTSVSDGVEFTGKLAINESLELTANLTYNETDRPNGLQRLRRPELLTNLGLSWSTWNDRLNVHGFYRAANDAIDEVFGSPLALDDYGVLDLSANYSLTESVELFARIENTLDEDYQEVTGFNSPDRASYIGIRASF